jgi:hypothetical protein
MRLDAGAGRTQNCSLAATPYRMELMALDVADAVRHAGGWMFDRVTLGWAVIVMLPECHDPRPLRILGVQFIRHQDALAIDEAGTASVIATRFDLHLQDERIRRRVDDALERGHTDVVAWEGDGNQAGPEPKARTLQHRLSAAARAFKAQALIALGVEAAVGPVEFFESFAATSLSSPIGLVPDAPADSA